MAQKITPEALFKKRPETAGHWRNHSAFQGLANSPILLKRILDSNPSLYEPVTANELVTITCDNELTKTSYGFLRCCIAGVYGMLFLKGLFERKPSLYAEVRVQQLGVVCHIKSNNQPVSALSCLTRNDMGIGILQDLLTQQPGEYLKITAEALCLVENGNITAQESLLSFLQTSSNGLAFWKDALKKRPDLKDFLTHEVKSLLEPTVASEPAAQPGPAIIFSYRPRSKQHKCDRILLKKQRPG